MLGQAHSWGLAAVCAPKPARGAPARGGMSFAGGTRVALRVRYETASNGPWQEKNLVSTFDDFALTVWEGNSARPKENER
jgi:hypothetical protein